MSGSLGYHGQLASINLRKHSPPTVTDRGGFLPQVRRSAVHQEMRGASLASRGGRAGRDGDQVQGGTLLCLYRTWESFPFHVIFPVSISSNYFRHLVTFLFWFPSAPAGARGWVVFFGCVWGPPSGGSRRSQGRPFSLGPRRGPRRPVAKIRFAYNNDHPDRVRMRLAFARTFSAARKRCGG